MNYSFAHSWRRGARQNRAPRPPPSFRDPFRQWNEVGLNSHPRYRHNRHEPFERHTRIITFAVTRDRSNPATYTTTIKHDANTRTNNCSILEISGYEVIKDLVDTRYVRNYRRNEWRLIAQSLTAALKSDRRDKASQVNSGSGRPK